MLIGYGAHAICPYLAYETCRQWRTSSRTVALIKAGKVPDITVQDSQKNFKKSIEKGILKVRSACRAACILSVDLPVYFMG